MTRYNVRVVNLGGYNREPVHIFFTMKLSFLLLLCRKIYLWLLVILQKNSHLNYKVIVTKRLIKSGYIKISSVQFILSFLRKTCLLFYYLSEIWTFKLINLICSGQRKLFYDDGRDNRNIKEMYGDHHRRYRQVTS